MLLAKAKAKAKLRFALIGEGISFDDLEPKSPIGVVDKSLKSHAEFLMYKYGISVQDLKKGTIYEDGEKIEDIKIASSPISGDDLFLFDPKGKERFDDLDYNYARAIKMKKDREMYGDLDGMTVGKKKMMKKILKIEKQKMMKKIEEQKFYDDEEKRGAMTRP